MFAVVGFVPYTGISSLGRYVTITPMQHSVFLS